MCDLISRQEVIKAMQESEFGYTYEVDVAIEAVKALPTVEPEGMGEMSENLISRKEMIRAVDSLGEDYISYYKLLLLIGKMPSAEPERKKGEWIYEGKRGRFPACKCSICGYYENADWAMLQGANYCPNCGADMREE